MVGDPVKDPRTGEVIGYVSHDFAHRGKNADLLDPVDGREPPEDRSIEAEFARQSLPRLPGSGRRISPKRTQE